MPLSYQNLIDTNKLKDAIGGTASANDILKKSIIEPRYIKGYADDTFWETIANKLGINRGALQQLFGLQNRKLDDYDPYHTNDAKTENFLGTDAKSILSQFDENTFTFKNSLYSLSKYAQYRKWEQFLYEDPLLPGFQLFIDPISPLFSNDENTNSVQSFLNKYVGLIDVSNRVDLWNQFKTIVYTIFDQVVNNAEMAAPVNMPYLINKIDGLENLKKKMIKYGEDKITITLSENVAMLAQYLAELYNNLVYSYKDQRYMFPENVLRFDLYIKITDIRNFLNSTSNNQSSPTNPSNPNDLNTVGTITD